MVSKLLAWLHGEDGPAGVPGHSDILALPEQEERANCAKGHPWLSPHPTP